MCIVCENKLEDIEGKYYLDCCEEVKEINEKYFDVTVLFCVNSKITKIPKELTKLEILYCSYTNISKIPKELIIKEASKKSFFVFCKYVLNIRDKANLFGLFLPFSLMYFPSGPFSAKRFGHTAAIVSAE